jgi:hypothetical protein
VAFIVKAAQLVQQVLKMGREARVRLKVPLQPFAHGVADRSGGVAIDLFAAVADVAVHGGFRFLAISLAISKR